MQVIDLVLLVLFVDFITLFFQLLNCGLEGGACWFRSPRRHRYGLGKCVKNRVVSGGSQAQVRGRVAPRDQAPAW